MRLLLPAALFAAAAFSSHAQPIRVLNMICSAGPACEVLAKQYQKATGTKINLVARSTGEALAQINAERASPKTDIWYGGTGDPHLQAAEMGLLETNRPAALPQLHDWAVRQAEASKYQTVGIYLGPMGFSYNPEVLAKKKLPVPACWRDLVKPEYKGEIQMANPHSSGTAYLVIATVAQLMGDDAAFDYMGKLNTNISQYPRSGSAPMRNAARGENAIGLSFIADVVAEAQAGFPIKWAVPCEGTGYEIGSLSIMKGARNLDEAKRFVDWALTPAVQDELQRESKAPQYASHKMVAVYPGMPTLSELKLINYDFPKYGSSAVRNGLLSRWDKEIGSKRQ